MRKDNNIVVRKVTLWDLSLKSLWIVRNCRNLSKLCNESTKINLIDRAEGGEIYFKGRFGRKYTVFIFCFMLKSGNVRDNAFKNLAPSELCEDIYISDLDC